MTPLFTCFPVRMTFVAIGIVGVVVFAFGLYNPVPEDEQTEVAEKPSPYGVTGPPPLWVFPLMLVLLTALMLLLNWYWPE